ncbi:hypothetical protein FACS1894172_09370 [Spirochaetia bacterium]|nr:hypothetical protein FACS1894172_09370 [Spirochaetia bacterium]
MNVVQVKRKNNDKDFQDMRSELTVLGVLMNYTDAALPEDLTADLFCDLKNKIIFNAIASLRARGLKSDLLTVTAVLRDGGYIGNTIDLGYLTDATNYGISPANMAFYVGRLKEDATRRSLMAFLEEAYKTAGDRSQDINQVFDSIKEVIQAKTFTYGVKEDPNPTIKSSDLAKKVFPEQKWVVPGLVSHGINLIAGPPKIRKSFLTLGVLIAAGTGGRAFGSIPVEQQNALYISLEDDERRLQHRQSDMGLTGGSDNIEYATNWTGGCEALRIKLSQRPDIKVVAIDTLFLFSDTNKNRRIKDMNAYAETTSATYALKQVANEFGIAIIVVSHTRKGLMGESAGMENILGSQGLAGAVDNILVLKKREEKDTVDFYVNGRDRVDGEKTFVLKWDTATCNWAMEGNREEVELGKTQQFIVDWLGDNGAATPGGILKGLSKDFGYAGSIGTIGNILSRMVESGKLYHEGTQYSVEPFGAEKPVAKSVESVDSVESKEDSRSGESTGSTVNAKKSEEGPESGVICVVDFETEKKRRQTTADDSKKPEKNEKSASPAQLVDALFEYLSAFPMTIEEMVAYCNQHKSGFMNVPMMESFIMEMVTAGEIEKKGENRYIRRQ